MMSIRALLTVLSLVVLCGAVSGYWTIVSLEVCNAALTLKNGKTGIENFKGNYSYNESPGDYGLHLPFLNPDNNAYEFHWHTNSNQYEFKYSDDDDAFGNARLRFKQQSDEVDFFEYLWEHREDCNCDNVSGHVNADAANDFTLRMLPSNNYKQNQDAQDAQNLQVCATWEDIDRNHTWRLLEDGFNSSVDAADQWQCRDIECDSVTDLLEVEYRGFEVFSDDNCLTRERATQEEYWKCNYDGCNTTAGYLIFNIDDDVESDDVRLKCRECRDIFGQSCEFCQRSNGCGQCTDNARLNESKTIIYKSAECTLQYCANDCCESGNDTFVVPTSSPTELCNETAAANHLIIGGSGTTIYNCDNQTERAAVSEAYAASLYWLPDPYSGCAPGVGIVCPPLDIKCKDCEDGEGCSECKEDFYWYSNAHDCFSCDEFQNKTQGCTKCGNAGDLGGGGCRECDSDHVLLYDEEIEVFYCDKRDNTVNETRNSNLINLGWNLTCIDECETTRGPNGYCACGCNCTGCTIRESPIDPEPPYYCIDCHYDAGCDQCHNNNEDPTEDYFMLSKLHPCANCYDTFGYGCLFCNDHIGCGQCRTNWHPVLSECCGMVYCEEDSVNSE